MGDKKEVKINEDNDLKFRSDLMSEEEKKDKSSTETASEGSDDIQYFTE